MKQSEIVHMNLQGDLTVASFALIKEIAYDQSF